MKFDKFLNEFEDYLKVRKFSELTSTNYVYETKRFFNFIEEHYSRIVNITQITKDVIIDFSNYLNSYKDRKGKKLSVNSQVKKLVILKRFFKFLFNSDYIVKDPIASLELPKKERTLPRNIPTEKEMIEILESCHTRTPQSLRNRAILETFYSTGMRTSELCNLKIHDVDLKEQTAIIVLGKGGKTRIVPLGQYSCFYIEEYLNRGRKFMLKGNIKDEGYLFLSKNGIHFTRDTINKVIRQVMKNIKLNKHISCYSFRHATASHLVKNKVDIRYVSELLGHTNLQTTQRYCHLEISDLKKMHALYHPREQTKTSNQNIIGEEKNP
jgi:integrase/recombinase XerD